MGRLAEEPMGRIARFIRVKTGLIVPLVGVGVNLRHCRGADLFLWWKM